MAVERGKVGDMWGCLTGESARVQLALLTVQLGYGIYYVLTKSAMSGGVNQFVFAVYRDVIALSLIVPLAYFTEKDKRTPLTLQTSLLIFVLGITGIFLQQTLFLAGLAFTNTAFAAAMQNAIPVFTFLIAVVCKIEVIRFSKPDGLAKVVGILAAVVGSFTMCLYKGTILFGDDPAAGTTQGEQEDVARSSDTDGFLTTLFLGFGIDYWQIGALCLVANCFCMGAYSNLQIPTLRRFPAPISLTALCICVGASALLATGLASVSQASDWVLSSSGNIVSVIYAGAIASGLNFSLQTWANQRGGPVLVAAYIPLQTVFSGFLGLMILDDPLYLGSVIGAALILLGLYLVIWGQSLHRMAQEKELLCTPFSGVLDDTKEPLLKESKSAGTSNHGSVPRS
ncbi:hypothetical protein MPTK1_5g12400 [Marchantia polymorpha subsp. ruderalis]|uniref:WAT1-related protein n=2 Tax=Marchantia polymorpha TaxID=3197 RepID=A0AAF6BHL1_MARPO|nr:hypothetical protein MARPO_0092s0066 [Marchantia polymorpha]BBN11495.1 hypothetical protein Mp_5g12400 [Marchantia polymorpha subsp. ruderalis]|eukprot:PTQ33105.1 hypothetical protein MARPO_0092s0066 [Marchantia polymorpha]